MSCLKHVLQIIDILDDPKVSGEKVREALVEFGVENVKIIHLSGSKGKTDLVKIIIPGKNGKEKKGNALTLGIIGRLGGVGARPEITGIVSDADGAIVALACAAKLGESRKRGDILDGDVIITTHITPSAPIKPHKPVPFTGSPIDIIKILKHEVDPKMDAILSVDATKGNRVIKVHGFTITPTVKDGWILKVSDDLISIYERVTGDTVSVVPITMQDITPYIGNIYHINSIMQPWLMTSAPVVGVATTAKVPVPGCGTGANDILGLEKATRFCVEVAKEFTSRNCKFYDEKEFKKLIKLYGDMSEIFRKNLKQIIMSSG